MAVAAENIRFRLSGGATNKSSNAALGGIMSADELNDDVPRNLFDDVTGGEAAAGDVEYRCYYVRNNHATDTASVVRVYITQDTPSAGTELDIGLDPAGVGNGTTTGVAVVIANEGATPFGVNFSHPTTFALGLDISSLGPGQAQAVWVRRTVTASAASAPNDQATLAHGVDA